VSEPDLIASVDPGLAHVGWAIGGRYGARPEIVESGYIPTDPKAELDDRLREIWLGLVRPFKVYRPKVVAIENQGPASIGKRKKQLEAAAKGEKAGGWNASNDHVFEVVGIAKAVAWSYGARVVMYAVQTAKKVAADNGNATKQEVINAIRRIWFPGIENDGQPLSEHEADAIAGFICVERTLHMQSKVRRRSA
jgi:Holliday junction resolvasome RuvABC endonuclease subunit